MDYSNLKEKTLIRKSQRGDAGAFDEIISRNSEYVFAWIASRTNDTFLIEELRQVTMIKCWKNIKKFKGESTFRTWACAIARNLFIDNYRKSQKNKEESLEVVSGENKDRLIGGSVEPDFLENLRNKELRTFLDIIMDGLSTNHRNALCYFALEGLTYQEISKIEKCSVGTIMSRLFYARRKAQSLILKNKNNKFYCGNA